MPKPKPPTKQFLANAKTKTQNCDSYNLPQNLKKRVVLQDGRPKTGEELLCFSTVLDLGTLVSSVGLVLV